MKRILCLVLIVVFAQQLFAQTANLDTTGIEKVTINKDPRLDLLAKAQYEINNSARRFAKGYRLFVVKTNNRDYAMQVRSYLLQNFPDEKVIMSYQSPFIKMKFGDFEDKKDAEKCRDLILKGGVVTGNVYIVPDTIEIKPDKEGKEDSK
jgi:hypothetical protein